MVLCLLYVAQLGCICGYQVERKSPKIISGDESLQVIYKLVSQIFQSIFSRKVESTMCAVKCERCVKIEILQCHTCNSDEDPSGCTEADPGPLVG